MANLSHTGLNTRAFAESENLPASSDLRGSGNLTTEQRAARLRTRERMRQGCHLGGRRVKLEEIYGRRTDYS